MNHERAMLLVAALESGEYKQGRHRLRSTADRFCCLGLACNIYAQHHPKVAAQQKDSGLFMGAVYDLPDAVQKWFGFNTSCGLLKRRLSDGSWPSLTSLNDQGRSFAEIAAFISLHWEDL